MIRISEVRLDEKAEELVLEVMRSGQLAQGPMVAAFEQEFAGIANTAHAVATSSGTTALVAALQALDVRPGDEVIAPAFTFVATLNAILETGATARLVDISPDDFTIDPDLVAEAITTATKAIIPVHLYGYPADMDRLADIAGERDIPIIEDAAQAHGARVGDRPVGSWGMAAFSLYATKNITTGEGGMITTNDDVWADKLRLLRGQGMRTRYQYELPGHNYRMTDLQAAIGLSQLASLHDWNARRQSNARALQSALAGLDGIKCPHPSPARHHVFHQFTIRVTEDAAVERDKLANALKAQDIETGVYYPRAVHDYDCYRHHRCVRATAVPHTERAARQVLSLPVHQWLTPLDIERVGEAMTSILERHPTTGATSARPRGS